MENYKNLPGVYFVGMANTYTIFGHKSPMEQNKLFRVERGVKLYSLGYALSCCEIVATEPNKAVRIYNGSTPELVEEWELHDSYHRNPYFRFSDDGIRPISEKRGIGTYFDESGELIPEDVIERSIIHADAIVAALEAEKVAQNQKREEIRQKLREEFADILTPITGKHYGKEYQAQYKANLTAMIKHVFPGLKFSIAKREYGGWRIKWSDGPTKRMMEQSVGNFKRIYTNDNTGEYGEWNDTEFTNLFGGADTLDYTRVISPELIARATALLNDALNSEYIGSEAEKLNQYLSAMNGEDIPNGYGFEHYDRGYWPEHFAKQISAYAKPAPKASKPANQATGEFQILDYSEKAIAVVGDTTNVKNELKQLGGRFNPRLSCGAGWIFSKKKESQVREFLNL